MNSEFLNYKQTSELLNLPLGTVYAMVSQNRLPCHRFGKRLVRFSKNELQEWIQLHRIEFIKKVQES